jgi:hypothetical protein
MRTIFLFIALNAPGQKAIEIPGFKNINAEDKYPERSILATYTNNFDILISLNRYSAWGPDNSIKILAHHVSGWFKIEINRDEKIFEPYTVCLSTYKINDSIGNILWDALKQNHLFEMKDGRKIGIACITTDTIRHKNGTFRTDEVFHGSSSDGTEYEFEIFTKENYKKLYFYSPQDLVDACPDRERKWIINCIIIFEKYLGK